LENAVDLYISTCAISRLLPVTISLLLSTTHTERERERSLFATKQHKHSNAASNKMTMWHAARRSYRPPSWPP